MFFFGVTLGLFWGYFEAILGLLWGYFGAMFFFGVTLVLFWGYLGLFWDSYDQDATVSSMTPNHSQ